MYVVLFFCVFIFKLFEFKQSGSIQDIADGQWHAVNFIKYFVSPSNVHHVVFHLDKLTIYPPAMQKVCLLRDIYARDENGNPIPSKEGKLAPNEEFKSYLTSENVMAVPNLFVRVTTCVI